MKEHGNEICEKIGQNILDEFQKHPTVDNIEVRCFEPIYASEYPLGENYPRYMGSIYCSILRAGKVDDGHMNFKDLLLQELCLYQPDVKHTVREETNFLNYDYSLNDNVNNPNKVYETIDIDCYCGKYIETIGRNVYVKELVPGENLIGEIVTIAGGPLSTDTLV